MTVYASFLPTPKTPRLANWDKTSDKYSESHVETHFGIKKKSIPNNH